MIELELNPEQKGMLAGERGTAKQMAMRLLVDLAAAAGARELVPVASAHISGVSPLTGGMGLRRFLATLTQDAEAKVAVSTTLNAAGCDSRQFEAMRIAVPGFLEQSLEIISFYTSLGVRSTQSCIPYEWDGVITSGRAAWAESNAICFGNSYCQLRTNRESGLSALASALTGYTPRYGLLEGEARLPNLKVNVTAEISDPTDFSILGDWIGKQRQPHWKMPFGPIPLLYGLSDELSHEQKKALTAAAANYGCPLLYIDGHGEKVEAVESQATLNFSGSELAARYQELAPRQPVSLVTIGCPQASIGEIRSAAALLQGKTVSANPEDGTDLPPIWIFTSSANRKIAEQMGLTEIIANSGALLLENTCPEVVPYDNRWVKHILTNSMKAEHYLKSGLNTIPTSVMSLVNCVAIATGERRLDLSESFDGEPAKRETIGEPQNSGKASFPPQKNEKVQRSSGGFRAFGRGLPSQDSYKVVGRALVTDSPITFLGFVNRETGVIEERGHPADGQSMAGKIAIFPRGSGSTVAPYVLLELFYRGRAPLAVVNTEIDQQTAPACSLEGIPYAYGFDADLFANIRDNDLVELTRQKGKTEIRVLAN